MWAFLPLLQPCWAPAPTQAPQPKGAAREHPGWAGWAGWHALHTEPRQGHLPNPNQSLRGWETPTPGEGPHFLCLGPPKPSLPLPTPKGFLCWGPHGGRGEGDTIRIWGCFPPSKAPRALCLGCPVCAPALQTPPPSPCATWTPTEQHRQGAHIRPRPLSWPGRRHPQMPGPRCPEDH